jgi:8-oxo-dGTP pyrophosphatase MutT (NUDIX family)
MALPGGRVDPADAGAFEAAVRETLEEVGLDLAVHGELLGQLDPVQAVTQGSVTDLWIHPFVFALHELPPLRLSDEVVATVWAPLQALRSGELAGSLLAQAAGSERRFPTWEVEGRVVWGLTYRMLTDLFECIGARELDSTAASHVVRLPTRRS